MMQYSINNRGQGIVCIRILAPEYLTYAFLAFIEQKSRENPSLLKKSSQLPNEDYFMKLQQKIFETYDQFIKEGLEVRSAISATNNALKLAGYANVSYGNVTQILSKSGRFNSKNR